jgi:hypothetical protein
MLYEKYYGKVCGNFSTPIYMPEKNHTCKSLPLKPAWRDFSWRISGLTASCEA